MSVPLTVQGATFNYPQQFDTNWGPTLTNWSTAVTNALAALPSTGILTLSPYPTAKINFANATNSGFLVLTTNSSNQLTFQGTPLATSGGGTVNLGTTNQLAYYATTGTAISGLTSITANRVLESDVNGLPVASGVTSTTLAFLDATSSIQTQINTKAPSASPTINNPTLTGTVTVPNATTSTEATAFGQVQYAFQNAVQIVYAGGPYSVSPSAYNGLFSASITPTSSSSRIKITFSIDSMLFSAGPGQAHITIFRNAGDIAPNGNGFISFSPNVTNASYPGGSVTVIDSPATTSSTTYTIYAKCSTGTLIVSNFGGATPIILEELR